MWKIICPPNNWRNPIEVDDECCKKVLEMSRRLHLVVTVDNVNKKIYVGSEEKKKEAYLHEAVDKSLRSYAEDSFPIILKKCKEVGCTKPQIAYILATATHESGAGKWMEEFASGKDYEGRLDLGNNKPGDGVKYKGRGFVQLTGRRNYNYWATILNKPEIMSDPNIVKQKDIAADILVQGMINGTFTGLKLGDFVKNNGVEGFYRARQVVNGMDRADHIATIADNIYKMMV